MKTKTKTSAEFSPANVAIAIPLDQLTPRADNRRVDDAGLDELAESLQIIGQLHPIHVRPLDEGRYEIVAGVRRWLALRKRGGASIDAVVHEGCDEVVADAIRIAENEHRSDPTALDTARGLRRIKNLHGFSHAEVAAHTSIGLANVKRYLSIFAASDAMLAALEKEQVSLRLAVELVRYEKELGEVSARKLLKRLGSGELTIREVAALRKRAKAASARPSQRSATDPWQSMARRIDKLIEADPTVARAQLEAALGRIAAQEGPAS